MSYPLIIYVVVWAALVIPIGRYARRTLRSDRIYEGDELDPISRGEAAALGMVWAGLWPAGVIVLALVGIWRLVGLLMPDEV